MTQPLSGALTPSDVRVVPTYERMNRKKHKSTLPATLLPKNPMEEGWKVALIRESNISFKLLKCLPVSCTISRIKEGHLQTQRKSLAPSL